MKTIAVCLAALLCGCSITGHLERRQYCADVLHVSREQREREQQTYQPPALKIEWDSNRFYLVPTEVQENGERIMAMQIQQVTIRAKARTLPERLGKVIIDFVIDMPRQLQGACRSVIVTPYLHKYGEAHALQDITIRGGLFSRVQQRDYWQFGKYVRAFAPDSSAEARRACGSTAWRPIPAISRTTIRRKYLRMKPRKRCLSPYRAGLWHSTRVTTNCPLPIR